MAWPVLVTVAKAVPWLALVQQAPAILDAANRLRAKSRPEKDVTGNSKSVETQVDEIHGTLAHLQAQDRDTAEVISQLALQHQEMAIGIQTLARKTRLLAYGLLIAILVALVAIAKAFV